MPVFTRLMVWLLILVLLAACVPVTGANRAPTPGAGPASLTALPAPAAATAVATAPVPGAEVTPPVPWPAQAWPASTPEEQGVDAQALADIVGNVRQRGMHIHSLLVIRHGYSVAELYFAPFAPGLKHEQFSITKAVTSAAIGAAVAEGKLQLDQRLLSFFPNRQIANRDARKEAITIRDLLTMTAGFAWDESSQPYGNPANMETRMAQSPDWVQFVLDLPMADAPGTRFVYNSGAAHLLSAVLQRATGQTLLEYARAHLFAPLGISDVRWPADPQGITEGHIGLWLQPADMARIGYLYLHDGRWHDRQVLPASWVRASTAPDGGPNPNYGYQWRRPKFAAFEAVGWGSQLIGVVPGQDLVVVLTAGVAPGEPEAEEKLFQDISQQAVKAAGPLPADPFGVAALARLAAAVARPQPQPVPALPAVVESIAGQTYALTNAPEGVRSLSLSFDGQAAATLALQVAGDEQRLAVGLDQVYRFSDIGGSWHAAIGRWQDARTFVVEDQVLGAADTTIYTLTFTDDRLDGRAASHIEDHTLEIHGRREL